MHNSIDFLEINIDELGLEENTSRRIDLICSILNTTFLHLKKDLKNGLISSWLFEKKVIRLRTAIEKHKLQDNKNIEALEIERTFKKIIKDRFKEKI